jgi:hypothetical protein
MDALRPVARKAATWLRPLYQLGNGGITILASSASIETTASTSFRSPALM